MEISQIVHKDSKKYETCKSSRSPRPRKLLWSTGENITKFLKLDLVSPASPALPWPASPAACYFPDVTTHHLIVYAAAAKTSTSTAAAFLTRSVGISVIMTLETQGKQLVVRPRRCIMYIYDQ